MCMHFFGEKPHVRCPNPVDHTLNALHIEIGAHAMVPFAGYSMPVQYPAGLMAEHHHTRNAAGLLTYRTWASYAWSGLTQPPPSRP